MLNGRAVLLTADDAPTMTLSADWQCTKTWKEHFWSSVSYLQPIYKWDLSIFFLQVITSLFNRLSVTHRESKSNYSNLWSCKRCFFSPLCCCFLLNTMAAIRYKPESRAKCHLVLWNNKPPAHRCWKCSRWPDAGKLVQSIFIKCHPLTDNIKYICIWGGLELQVLVWICRSSSSLSLNSVPSTSCSFILHFLPCHISSTTSFLPSFHPSSLLPLPQSSNLSSLSFLFSGPQHHISLSYVSMLFCLPFSVCGVISC